MNSKTKTPNGKVENKNQSEGKEVTYEKLKDQLLAERAKRCMSVGEKLGKHVATILLYENLSIPASLTAMCVAVAKFLDVIAVSQDEDPMETYNKFIDALSHYLHDNWDEDEQTK